MDKETSLYSFGEGDVHSGVWMAYLPLLSLAEGTVSHTDIPMEFDNNDRSRLKQKYSYLLANFLCVFFL